MNIDVDTYIGIIFLISIFISSVFRLMGKGNLISYLGTVGFVVGGMLIWLMLSDAFDLGIYLFSILFVVPPSLIGASIVHAVKYYYFTD